MTSLAQSRLPAKLRTAAIAATGVLAMLGVGFASVPLYRLFCEATGLNGTTNRGTVAPGGTHHQITMAFDSNTSPRLPWRFVPEKEEQVIEVGARSMAFFDATNRGAQAITGTATHNVTPAVAGKYFTKIQCFCFTQQTLAPGETQRMPVIYYVDPKILTDPDTKDVQTITLSYTFYPVDSGKAAG